MSGYAIGIDVGGTKIAGALVRSADGQVLAHQRTSTLASEGGQQVLDRVCQVAKDLLAVGHEKGWVPDSMGIGIAELVDLEGRVTSAHTIDWSDLDYQGDLNAVLPTRMETDIRAAARAEAVFGAGRDLTSFAYVSVGTGIGGCLVVDGIPFAGARGNAIILGSGALSTVCDACGHAQSVVLEDVASGPAMARTIREADPAVTRCEDLFERARSGDPAAVDVVRRAGRALGVNVAFMLNLMDPEAVIVGGGVGTAEGPYWDSFVSSTREHVWSDATASSPILQSRLDFAGCVGAAIGISEVPEG